MPARVTRGATSQSKPSSNIQTATKSNTSSEKKKKPVSASKTNGTSKQTPAPAANISRKRARTSIKKEEPSGDDDEVETTAAPPTKRAKKPAKSKVKLEPKSEADLEAIADLADAPLPPTKPASNPYNLTPGSSPYPNYPHPTPAACADVCKRLSSVHGNVTVPTTVPQPSLKSSGCGAVPSVLDALVRTRLSANTNNRNSDNAFQGLVARFGVQKTGPGAGSVDWDAVRRADVGDVFEAIKTGGLAGVKSRDIKAILELVHAENVAAAGVDAKKGDAVPLSLDHLHDMPTDAAFEKLVGYPGVGPKTASCVLLFCMRRPSFAVDTHVFRLTRALGWTPSDAQVRQMGKASKTAGTKAPPPVSRNTTYAHLDIRIPDELKYPLHYLLIKHGKTCPSCMARRDGKVKEAWGNKKCPIADLKGAGGKNGKKEEDAEDDMDDMDEDDED